ncbi:hypothetical protein PIROE2DRAFT_17058 [Piromyces sp. E2]|nr:hypothetical protein PIROE2DRAFT_17058 [Piromyces sp. E2]|eukprot:OUM57840.1 hypothetical protein PIROE2DRAFT_17058 [Piromyces sp. E2]
MPLYNNIYTTLIPFILILFLINANAQKITLYLKQPDMQETFDLLTWEQNYENSINEFLKQRNVDNPILKNVTVELYFYEYFPVNVDHQSEYLEFIKDLSDKVGNATVDMMILDDRLLFNDIALIECDSVELYYKSRTPTKEHLLDLTPFYFDRSVFKHHDRRILKDGTLDNKIYGIPYEIDFDLLYYYSTNEKAKTIVDMMNKLSWDDLLLLSKFQSTDPFYISLGDEDDLLNLFLEYTSNKYSLSKDLDKSFFNIFYNETSEHLFTSFKSFVNTYTDNNFNNTFGVSLDQVLKHFINEEILFFRGKASHAKLFNEFNNSYNKTVLSTLPPKFMSIVTEKFLVLNRHSKIDATILTEIALQLTSKEMQYTRAKNFGSIPTFDININDDEVLRTYCQNFPDICQKLRILNKIFVKDVFQSRYSPPLFETRLLLPSVLKKYIYDKNSLQQTIYTFKNIKELATTDIDTYITIIYIATGIGIMYTVYNLIYIYKFRDHPYIKVISPKFCMVIIIGYLLTMIEPVLILPPYFILKCKFLSSFEIFFVSLIILPMIIVTYRIYAIFKNKSVAITTVNDRPGSRIKYIIYNNKRGLTVDANKYINTTDLIDYVALRKNGSYNPLQWIYNIFHFNKIKNNINTKFENENFYTYSSTDNIHHSYASKSFSTYNTSSRNNYLPLQNSPNNNIKYYASNSNSNINSNTNSNSLANSNSPVVDSPFGNVRPNMISDNYNNFSEFDKMFEFDEYGSISRKNKASHSHSNVTPPYSDSTDFIYKDNSNNSNENRNFYNYYENNSNTLLNR